MEASVSLVTCAALLTCLYFIGVARANLQPPNVGVMMIVAT